MSDDKYLELKNMGAPAMRSALAAHGVDSTGYKAELPPRLERHGDIKLLATNKRKREEIEKARVTQKGIADMLECPICEDNIMGPQIHQCKNGHTFCAPCKSKFATPQCPTCNVSIVPARLGRALPLEKAAEHIPLPCKYKEDGCPDTIAFPNYHEHVKDCDYRPFACPTNLHTPGNCDWTGKVGEIHDHMKDAHEAGEKQVFGGYTLSSEHSTFDEYTHFYSDTIYKAPESDDLFYLILKRTGHTYNVTAHRIGQKTTDAYKWKVTFGMKGQGGRSIRWTFPVSSIRTRHDVAYNEGLGHCFSIPVRAMKYFDTVEKKKKEGGDAHKDKKMFFHVDMVKFERK